MGSFSLAHWLIVIVVLLLVFGPKRLSEVGKGLGQGIRNFKKGIEGDSDAKSEEEAEEPRKLSKKRDADEPKRLRASDDEDADEDVEEERPRKKKKVRRV